MAKKPEMWAVGNDSTHWLVIDLVSGRTKKIGIVGATRSNYYDSAVREAINRNRRATGIAGYIYIAAQYHKNMDLKKYIGSHINREE